jgi:hypothetical protein
MAESSKAGCLLEVLFQRRKLVVGGNPARKMHDPVEPPQAGNLSGLSRSIQVS